LEQNKKVKLIELGLIDYKEAWDFQEKLFNEIIELKIENRNTDQPNLTPNYLITCQHPHVYTLGKSGKEDHLLIDDQELEHKDAKFYKINRGGDITYHGPGQLVVYPIIDLDNFFTDIHLYMRCLEEAVIKTCADYNLNAGRIEGLTGVWLSEPYPRKICAMGVKSSRWVTMHGLALNVNTDLNYFGNIVPCGIDDKAVTSIQQEIGKEIDMKGVEKVLVSHLAEVFGMQIF